MRRDPSCRRFRGRELAVVSAQARAAFGDDAVVLRTLTRPGLVEIVAAAGRDVERFRARLTPAAWTGVPGADGRAARPYVVALVGPTGAGKTTTAVKLAVHPDALGGTRNVGFVTLDTYRAGAVAQLETFARVAGLPLEVVYEPADVTAAARRLSHCDVVIVDTPGRGPKDEQTGSPAWREALALLAPDEVHLVMPATVRVDVAESVVASLAAGPAPVTHALLTKLDEVPGESGVSALAAALDLPVRWVTDGQMIPTDLAVGVPRLLHALGAAEAA